MLVFPYIEGKGEVLLGTPQSWIPYVSQGVAKHIES